MTVSKFQITYELSLYTLEGIQDKFLVREAQNFKGDAQA
jgi:hypothetical protein